MCSYQEAIDTIKNEIRCIKNKTCTHEECANCSLVLDENSILDALNIAIELIHRNIAHSVELESLVEFEDKTAYATFCPHCGRRLFPHQKFDTYCAWCGQKLDWSELYNNEYKISKFGINTIYM